MIKYFKKTGPLKIYEIWFDHHTKFTDLFSVFGVFHLKKDKKIYGVKTISHTIEIELQKSSEEVFNGFNKKIRQDYRHAEESDFTIEKTTDLALFANFFNEFAKQRNTFTTSVKRLQEKLPYLQIYVVKYKGEIYAAQSYLVDDDEKMIRYYQSSSLRLQEDIDKNIVARAGKYLLMKSIMMYNEQGYKIFDMGGYAMNTTDEGLQGINTFKSKFGGQIVECVDYYSYPYCLLKKLSKLIGYSATL